MAAGCESIDTVNNLVAYSQDFHNVFILPYNQFPGKPISVKIVFSLLFAIPPTAHYNSLIQFDWNAPKVSEIQASQLPVLRDSA